MPYPPTPPEPPPERIPLSSKLAYSGFVGVLVPVCWRRHGPGNFLWLSDVALFLTGGALRLESPLLASTAAVSLPPLVFLPSHLVLRTLFDPPPARRR